MSRQIERDDNVGVKKNIMFFFSLSFFRSSQKDCHLALPYYRMSGLSVTEVIARNRPLPSSPHSYGLGFLFYLNHYLLEETEEILSQVQSCWIKYFGLFSGRNLNPLSC